MKNRNGAILITAIFIILLIATLGIGYLSLVNNQLEMANVAVKSGQAFYTAESGISEAILSLKGINNWSALSGILVSGGVGRGTYTVEVVSEKPPVQNIITIKSTGKFADFQRIIQVTLDKETDPAKIIKKDWQEI